MKRNCLVCGKEFNAPPRIIKQGYGKYCSRKCAIENKSDKPWSKSYKHLGVVDDKTVYLGSHGYAIIVHGPSNEELLHRYIARTVMGVDLSSGVHVHHRDGNRLNNCVDNLMIVSKHDHALEHAKTRLRAIGGNPELDKYCGSCKKVLPKTEFVKSKNTYDGLYGRCKKCACLYQKRLREQRNGL